MSQPAPTPSDLAVSPAEGLRRRILELAAETVRSQGAEGLTMRSLAGPLGYSPATLYLHFRSKAELLEEVAGRGFEALGQAMEGALAEADPRRVLAQGAEAYLRFGLEDPHTYQLMFERRPASGGAGAGCRRAFGRIRTALEQAGGSGPGSGEERLLGVWSLLHGWLSLSRAGLLGDGERPESPTGSPQEAPEIVARQALSLLGL